METSPLTPEPEPERWLSTHDAAGAMGCHPQTVRDRCARGELSFTVDPASGHRRIAASELEARGYVLAAAANGHPASRRARTDFHAVLVAEVEGVLTESAVEVIAERLVAVLSERDEAQDDKRLAATTRRLNETRAALRELARAGFWRRRRLLARLRASGLLHERW
jgi:hypothetical protein